MRKDGVPFVLSPLAFLVTLFLDKDIAAIIISIVLAFVFGLILLKVKKLAIRTVMAIVFALVPLAFKTFGNIKLDSLPYFCYGVILSPFIWYAVIYAWLKKLGDRLKLVIWRIKYRKLIDEYKDQ